MGHEETVYDALDHAHGGEGQWAFGTGFDDPLAGVDTTVPAGVDPADLGAYCLMLGDDALVLSQRLTEWVTNAPELEEEVALANIALDLLGQARLLLARAGSAGVLGRSRALAGDTIPDEDALAYFRDPSEFRNTALVAAPNGDFGPTIVRLLVAASWRRSRPRAYPSWRTTGTTPPAGCCGSGTVRRSRTGGSRPGWTRSGRCWPTSSRGPTSRPGWPGSRSTRRSSGPRFSTC
jgi:Phenylacetic acid catabolic protein